jgi:serine/threonine protein kinase
MHYALVTNLDDNGRRRLLDYGIFPIEYTPSSSAHPEVSEFLEAVLTKYDPKKAEVFEDERNRPSSMTLLPVPDLRSMSFGARRDRLDLEFDALFEQTSNYALTGSSDLPSLIQYRREETQELLAGVWQVNTVPPTNAIDGREVLSEIGRGGFGVVYLVQDVRSHERQALKVAHFQETSNYKFVHRFKQGIRAMRRLTKHGVKNTTKYLGHREVPLCVFMEYIDGGDLGELIKNVDLDIDVRLQLAREIAEIVAEAHLIPVYHRDLKPSNVLVQWGEDGQPHAILSDFDLAWFEGAISKTTTRIGDQAFASPEQLKEGRAGLQARGESDVYSLGMLIMFLITRHIPSAGQWYNQNLRREVLDIAKRQFSWLHGANLFADLVMLCASEELSARPNVQQVRDVLSKIQEAEKTKLADYEMLIGEIKARLVDQHSDQAIHGSIFHVEYRRNAGRVVIQASFSRQLQVYDDRGRFKFVGDRTLKNLRTKLEKEGWSIQSQASTEFEGKLVVTQEIVSPSLDFAKDCITHLSDGLEYWLRW